MRWIMLFVLLASPLCAQSEFGILQIADTLGRDLERATVEFKRADEWKVQTADEFEDYSSGLPYGVSPIPEMYDVCSLTFRRVPRGPLTFRVTLEYYEPLEQTVIVEASRNCLTTFTLSPTPENTVSVSVLDADDNPVKNAKVRVRARTLAATDREGKAVAYDLFANRTKENITVLADGYEESEPQTVDKPGQTLTFRLTRCACIYGRVLGTARACAALGVHLEKPKDRTRAEYETRCDVNGNFSITLRKNYRGEQKFKGGDVTLRLTLGGANTDLEVVELTVSEWREVEVQAPVGGTLSGQLTGCDGKPLRNQYLTIEQFGTRDCHTYTDGEGRFKVGALPAGEYIVRPGMLQSFAFPEQGRRKTKVIAGKETVFNMNLSGKLAIRVRAFIDNVPVKFISISDWGTSIWASTDSAHGGWVTLNGVEPGRYELSLGIQKSGQAKKSLHVASTDKPQEFEVYVENHSISGRVKVPASMKGMDHENWTVTLYNDFGTALKSVPIADDDTYSITGINPGTYKLVARVPGFSSKPVIVEVDGDVSADLEMETSGTLKLKVTSDDDEPVAVTALLNIRSIDGGKAPSNMRGVKLIAGETVEVSNTIAPGKYSISFTALPDLAAGKRKAPVFLNLEAQEFEIAPGEEILLTVDVTRTCAINITGLPSSADSTDITVTDEEGNAVSTEFSVKSIARFTFAFAEGLKPGTYKVKIAVSGYKTHEAELELKLGEQTELAVKLEEDE